MNLDLKHPKYYSFIGRLVSAGVAFLSFYLGLPKVFGFSRSISFVIALVAALLCFLLDTVLADSRAKRENSTEDNLIFGLRILSSILTAWLGGFGVTLQTFWSVYLGYSKIYRGNYIQVFMRMLENNRDVLLSFIIISIALFIGDNLGRIFNQLAFQQTVIDEKEETIQTQVSEIQHKDEQLEQSYQQQIDIISSIQHELGNKLPIAKNTLDDLKRALSRISSFDVNQKIRGRHPGESEGNIDSYADLLNRLESNLHYGISIVDNIRGVLKADPTRFQPVRLNIKKYLLQEVPKHINSLTNVRWEVFGTDVELSIDPSQFTILLNNAIENARRHGFDTSNQPSPRIDFFIEENANSVILLIRNNGNGLPPNFTMEKFTKPGVVMGPTGHSGLGGYLISLVAVNHKAQIIMQEATSPYSVELSITFPNS